MELDQMQFAQRLVSGMSDAIVYADADGVIRLWNRGATRIFDFTEAEALGRSLDIIIPERLRERHWQRYRTTMRRRVTETARCCQFRLCGRMAQGYHPWASLLDAGRLIVRWRCLPSVG
jgi:PAS domain S-box-containing protein